MKKKLIFLLSIVMLLALGTIVVTSCDDNVSVDTYYNVYFDTQGGGEIPSQRVLEGNPVVRPVPPTRNNFSFNGWYTSAVTSDENIWNFDTDRVHQDMTLYAGWVQAGNQDPTASLVFERRGDSYAVSDVGDEAEIIIPDQYNGAPVTVIGESAFARKDITSVVIPDSVIAIELNAFHNCSHLVTVSISENSELTEIGDNAFSGNSSLQAIFIPHGVTRIGSSVFNNCGALDTISVSTANTYYYSEGNNLIERSSQTLIRGSNSSVIPDGVITIAQAAFRRSEINQINIPASVSQIGNYAFDDCVNLSEITVDGANSVYASLDGLLYNKALSELIEVPEGVSGEISLSEALVEIPMFAFDGRALLTSIFIPQGSLTRIANFAFRNTTLIIQFEGTQAEWDAITKASQWGGASLQVVFGENQQSDGILVVYFSYSGNTEEVAEYVAAAANATLTEIVPQIPYTAADVDYTNSSSRCQVERRSDARPEIADATYNSIDIDSYSTIFIGYPIWNGGEPMIIRTFLEHYEGLEGKTVYAFSTSSSSSGASAFNSIKSRCPDADVVDFCHLTAGQLSNAQARVNEWIDSLNLNSTVTDSVEGMRMKMSFSGNEILVTLVDSSATRDLVNRLKQGAITLSFSDYADAEKIAYIQPALDVSDVSGCDPQVGDLTIYIPWGNLAAFYRDTSGFSASLTLIGRIENNGIQLLAAQNGSFDVLLELV